MSKECAKYKIAKCYKTLLRRAVEILEVAAGENLITRNLECLEEFFDNAYEYIWVHDLPYIIRLGYSIYQKCSQDEAYVPYLLRFLDMCYFPPFLQRASDVLKYADDIIQYLSMLGYIVVSTQNSKIQNDLHNGLERLFSIRKLPINCVSQRVLNQMLAKSQLPVIVADVMHMADDTLYYTLLAIVRNLLDYDDTCFVFLEKKIVDLLFSRCISANVDVSAKTDTFKPPAHFTLTFEIVWRLCNAYAVAPQHIKDRVGYVVTKSSWEKARTLFRQLVTGRGFKKERNVLHNILVHGSITIKAELDYALYNDVVILSCAPENGSGGTWASDAIFSNDEDDFRFKMLMMTVHCYFRNKPMFPGIYQSTYCLLSMLRIITPEVQLIWTLGQRIKLIKYVLLCLECVVRHGLEDFMQFDGPKRLVKLYIRIVDGGLPTHYLSPCLRCIHRCLVEGAKTEMPNMFRSSGLIDLLLSYVKITFSRSPLTMEDQELLITTFCTLHHLNKDYKCLNNRVVAICINSIERFQKPSDKDCFLDPRVMIALLDYMWEHLKWSESSTNQFTYFGGVYLLLDVLEQSPLTVKLITLNILVDLTEQGKTFPFIGTWRGTNGISGIKLLLDVFRQGNFDNENVTKQGIIKDTELPLMGRRQAEITFNPFSKEGGSPACLDLLASTRPKVYALLVMIQCSPTKYLLRDQYKVYGTELSKLDKIAVMLAENFLTLKTYELWLELDVDVKRTGKKLLSFDLCVIQFHVQRSHKLAELVQAAQNELKESITDEELTTEANFYQTLRDQTLSDALMGIDTLVVMGTTTDRKIMSEIKRKEISEICSRRKRCINSRLNFHKSVMEDVACTKPFKQFLSIRSNVVIDPNKPEEILPVSASTSNENYHNAVRATESSNADISNISSCGLLPVVSEELTHT